MSQGIISPLVVSGILQTGMGTKFGLFDPGGVESPPVSWTSPLDIEGLILGLDIREFDTLTFSNGKVSAIDDLSPEGNNVNQSVIARQSTYNAERETIIFDGIDDYYICSHSDSLNLGSEFTVALKVKDLNGVVSTDKILLSKVVLGGQENGFSLTRINGQDWFLRATDILSVRFGSSPVTGNLQSKVMRRGATTAREKVDGNEISVLGFFSPPPDNTNDLLIGAMANYTQSYWAGEIQQIWVYNRAVTDAEFNFLSTVL